MGQSVLPFLMAAAALCSPAAERFEGSKPGEARISAGIALRWCPAGRFRMGSPASEPDHRPDERQVDVNFSRGFWMSAYEITRVNGRESGALSRTRWIEARARTFRCTGLATSKRRALRAS